MAEDCSTNQSVAGSWLGQYFYPGGVAGSNFEAVFVQSGSALEGNILDAGGLGEARANGSFSYPRINFRKVYIAPGYEPIEYEGTMAEDGKIVIGYWRIVLAEEKGIMYGVWIMYRDGGEEKFDLQKLAAEYPLDEEMDKLRKKENEKQPLQVGN